MSLCVRCIYAYICKEGKKICAMKTKKLFIFKKKTYDFPLYGLTMAANTKGKKRCKGKTLDLNTFLGDDQDIAPGYAVVPPRRSAIDWADTMENEDLDDRYTLDFKKEEKVVLPTAPKAARGPDVDLSKVPNREPFTAFLGNLPYDITDDDIVMFFRQLKVKNVRLPRENGDKGRIRGFGYAEFFNRQDLIQALALNNETLKNRAIKVTLAGEHDGDRGGDRDRRDGGVDRTLGDWRADKKDQFRDEPSRNDSYSSRGFSDRDSYRGGRSNFDRDFSRNDRYEKNGDRNDFSFSRNDRDFGRDQDRRSGDRGYGFSDRGGSRGGGGGRRDYNRDSFTRRDEGRDSRYRDSSERDFPSRDGYDRRPPDRPSYDSDGPKERRKLQLAPRTKPIEPVPPPAEAVASSSIFGGAKPVDTAAREREIEERLAREKETISKDPGGEDRVRKFSTGSGISNRSRRSSDSGPPGSYKEDDEPVPPYKPPIPRQQQHDKEPSQQYNTLPRARQRNSSNSSGGSDRENHPSSKSNHPPSNRKDNYSSNYYPRSEHSDDSTSRPSNENSYPDSRSGGGFRSTRHNHSNRDNSRERPHHASTYEEPKPPVYTSANKFSHLLNDAEDYDQGSGSD